MSMKKKVTNSEVSKQYIEMLKEKFAEKKQLPGAAEVDGVHNCWKLIVAKPARRFSHATGVCKFQIISLGIHCICIA